MADLFRSGRPFDPAEDELLSSWLSGWVVPDPATTEEFEGDARRVGFSNVRLEDVTANVWPGPRRLYRRALVGYPAAVLLRKLRLGDRRLASARSGLDQYRALRKDLWFYGIATATCS